MAEKKGTGTRQCTEIIFLQFDGKEVYIDKVREAIMENYDAVKKGSDPVNDVKIYLKPEDHKAYYVVNEDYAGEVDIVFE